MKIIKRPKNVIDNKNDLISLHEFKNFPVFMGCVEKNNKKDLFEDQSWSISPNNGVIQLNKLLPLNILYQESHGSGCVGSLWKLHHENFAEFIKKHSPQSILEIGGSHGILCREYKKDKPINWTIVEPNPSPSKDVDANFIKGFFDDKFKFDGEIDTIVHSHVFEHVYYPNEFISHISSFLKDGQKLIFSLPNLEEMLKRKYTNCLNFEHTVFLTEPYIEHILSRNGFRKINKEYFEKDHSIFFSYVKDSKTDIIELPTKLYDYNRTLFEEYINYHNLSIKELNHKIKKNNQPIFLFGAHIFSQNLINFGLDTKNFICILDNDSKKQSKRLYGTDLIVESPQILKDFQNPIIVLKAGIYNDEIKGDILNNINPSTEFWV